MAELTIIVPFVQEWPQVAFTLRSIAEELQGRVDFEIIAVDNWCDQVARQAGGRTPDRAHVQLAQLAAKTPWLRVLKYDKKLSHWQAKKLAIDSSTSPFIWFCDAHCVVSRDALFNMFEYYKKNHVELNGSIHLPLTYHIMETGKLIYKLNCKLDEGFYGYSFSQYRESAVPYEVPVMSTCGMMVSRDLYNYIGGWPEELGIYGGGENFFNFALSVTGKKKWISAGRPLYHHGEKRGYHYEGGDMVRNRAIAFFLIGGEQILTKYLDKLSAAPTLKRRLLQNLPVLCADQRKLIMERTEIEINDWVAKWN